MTTHQNFEKGGLRKIILQSKSVFRYYEPAILDIKIIYKKSIYISANI